MNSSKRTIVILVVMLIIGTSANAAITVSNATLAAGDGSYGGAAITTVDGTGLGSGFPTFPDTHNGFNSAGLCGPGTTASLHYDFGSQELINGVRAWNYHGVWNGPGTGVPERGAKDIALYGSNDASAYGDNGDASWTQFTTFSLARVGDVGDPSVTPYGEEFDFSDVTYQYVRLDILNTHGAPDIGLAEVQFIPEPATLVIMSLGGLLLRKRR